eukprot:13078519-Heterocapsa_arctica.AAC.1
MGLTVDGGLRVLVRDDEVVEHREVDLRPVLAVSTVTSPPGSTRSGTSSMNWLDLSQGSMQLEDESVEAADFDPDDAYNKRRR